MRSFVLILSLLYLSFAHAAPTPLLKCLAIEEQVFHQKKIQNPWYRLNQKVILMIAQFPRIEAKQRLLQQICEAKWEDHPSMILFEQMLIDHTQVFSIPKDIEEEQRALLENTLQEMKEGFPELLITFLADLQSTLEKANCLNQTIKEAEYFTDRFKYLTAVIPHEQLFEDKKKIRSLFAQLNNWQRIVDHCRLPVKAN